MSMDVLATRAMPMLSVQTFQLLGPVRTARVTLGMREMDTIALVILNPYLCGRVLLCVRACSLVCVNKD